MQHGLICKSGFFHTHTLQHDRLASSRRATSARTGLGQMCARRQGAPHRPTMEHTRNGSCVGTRFLDVAPSTKRTATYQNYTPPSPTEKRERTKPMEHLTNDNHPIEPCASTCAEIPALPRYSLAATWFISSALPKMPARSTLGRSHGGRSLRGRPRCSSSPAGWREGIRCEV